MRKYVVMEVAIVIGIVMLMSTQIVPSSAQQQDLPGVCWKNIGTCRRNATTQQEFVSECCPLLTKELNNNTQCFCGPKPILDQNPSLASGVDQLLTICQIGATFDTICPGPAQSPSGTPAPGSNLSPMGSPAAAPAEPLGCWKNIEMCVNDNKRRGATVPQLNTTSPLFNVTEFLCCSLVQQTAMNEKPCFCGITTVVKEDPSTAPNVDILLKACGITDSVASLSRVCPSEAPSEAPVIMMKPPTGPTASLAALSPAANPTNKESTKPQPGAANKIAIAGSLSSLLVLITYVLF